MESDKDRMGKASFINSFFFFNVSFNIAFGVMSCY